jgi:beta-lactamase class A
MRRRPAQRTFRLAVHCRDTLRRVDGWETDDVMASRRQRQAGFIRPPSPDSGAYRAGRPITPQTRVAAASRPASLRTQRPAGYRPLTSPYAPSRRSRLPRVLFMALLAVMVVLALFMLARLIGRNQAGGARVRNSGSSSSTRTVRVDPAFLATWQTTLNQVVAQHGPARYAVMALDLTTGASLSVDADIPYRAASVNKLELAIALYRRAQQHLLNLDDQVTITDADIQHYGTGTIQLSPAPQTYSYRDLVRLMIEESDNTAAYVLGNKLGLPSVQQEVASWGLTNTSLTDNTTTARDTAMLLQKLANNVLLPPAATNELIGYLENTAWNDRVQSGVPNGVPVAHKVGTDIGVFNDAAIVYAGNRPYILVVLGAGAGDSDGLDAITAISRTVWQFEQALPRAIKR